MTENNTNQQPLGAAPTAAPNTPPQQPSQQPQGQPYGAYGYAQPQPVYVAPAQVKSSKAPWIVLGVVLFAVVFCFTIGAMSCSSAVSTLASFGGSSSEGAVASEPSVAVIDISGTIQYDGTACSPEGLSALLEQAEADENIKAVVLRVDSGGGTATAGEEMAEYVKRFTKPVVVSSASMNCSAAYEISSQADKIFVNKTTDIGSIGTVMQVTDISELLDKLGIKVDNIASADSKDSSYGTRSLTDDERAYYQELIRLSNEAFIENVASGRNMNIEDVQALATGMPFTGEQAIANGLADELGIYDDALAAAAELAGIESGYGVVVLTQENELSSLVDMLSSSENSSAASAVAKELLNLLKDEGVLS